MKGARWLASLALLGALTGCHGAKPLVAPTADYGDYRAIRTAASLDDRLALTWDYLQRRPDGWYAERLRRYFDRAEPVFYKVRRQNVAGLEAYLRALPDGPHAEDAVNRVTALRIKKNREAVDADVLGDANARIEARKAQRAKAARALIGWAVEMLDADLWDGRDISRAPAGFLVRYELALPKPVCGPSDDGTRERCFKAIERPYRVTGQGRQGERSVAFAVEAELDGGRPMVLRLRGYNAFVRSEEAANNRVMDEPAAARKAFVQRLTEALLKAGRVCNGGLDTMGQGVFTCEGAILTISSGDDGADDIIEVAAAPSPSAPDAEAAEDQGAAQEETP